MLRLTAGVVLGLLLSATISLAVSAVQSLGPQSWSIWHYGTTIVGHALVSVAPGFLAGWYAQRQGLAVGATVGVLAALGVELYIWLTWSALPLDIAVTVFIYTAVAAAITQSVAGAAGQQARIALGSLAISFRRVTDTPCREQVLRRYVIGILFALLLSIALLLVRFAFDPSADRPTPTWFLRFTTIWDALSAVAPGLLAGWYVQRDGLATGTVVGIVCYMGTVFIGRLWWGPWPPGITIAGFIFAGVANVVTQAVAGMAGQYVRSWAVPLTSQSSGRATRAADFGR